MQKLYYSIGEVAELIDEEPHILRYWEKEFPNLRPKKYRGGKRAYSAKDIAVLKHIKKLLREDMLSLKGARERMRDGDIDFDEQAAPTVEPGKNAKPKSDANDKTSGESVKTIRKDDLELALETLEEIKFYLSKI